MTILVCPLQASMLSSHSTCIRTTMTNVLQVLLHHLQCCLHTQALPPPFCHLSPWPARQNLLLLIWRCSACSTLLDACHCSHVMVFVAPWSGARRSFSRQACRSALAVSKERDAMPIKKPTETPVCWDPDARHNRWQKSSPGVLFCQAQHASGLQWQVGCTTHMGVLGHDVIR